MRTARHFATSTLVLGLGITLGVISASTLRPQFDIVPPAAAVAGTLTLDGSTSGSASFAGNVTGAAFQDSVQGSTYYIDPNGATSAILNGNVAIGTTSTSYKLEVNGTQRVNGALTIGDASGDTVTSNAASWTLANDTNFVLSGGTNGISFDTSTLSVDATNNRIGVNTTAPLANLHINGGTNQNLWVSTNTNGAYSGTIGLVSVNDANNAYTPLGFYASKYYFGNGNVGIGTTDPLGALDVSSAATNNGYYLDGKAAVTGESADNWLRLNQNSSWTSGVFTPLLFRSDGGINVDGTTAIDGSNNMHYAYLSGTYDKFGKVNSSGFGIDANNSGNWDLLVYNGGQLYYNDVYMGYGGSAAIRTYDTNESLSIIPNGSGNVYIASPLGGAKLDVNGDFRVEATNFQIKIFDTDTSADEWAISTYNNQSLALFENGSGGTARFIFNTGANATAQADGVWTDNAFDLAEDYPISTGQSVEEGDLISISKHETERVGKSISRYDPNLMGVVSYHPAQLSGAFGTHPDGYVPGYKPIALVGRVPTKVTSENGPIKRGDPITSSSISGVGMKATSAGQIVGRALEPYDNNDPTKVGKIIVFVEPTQYDPDMIDGENSQIQLLQHKIDSQEKQLANFQTQIDELKKLIHEK